MCRDHAENQPKYLLSVELLKTKAGAITMAEEEITLRDQKKYVELLKGFLGPYL